MSSQHLTPFVGQRYLNLESVKRDGTPVQTPVWFAEEQGVLYVYTLANAGKVKRIRRHPRIRHCPLYHARHSDRTLGGGGSHHRGCHDRSPWACLTPAQIWLDEGDRRPVQSSDAPGTGRHRHAVARVTMGADRRERQWWKRSASRRRSPCRSREGYAVPVLLSCFRGQHGLHPRCGLPLAITLMCYTTFTTLVPMTLCYRGSGTVLACMETPEIGLETFAGAFRLVPCLEAVLYCPSALIITPRPPDLILNLPGIPDEPIFLAWFRLLSRRCSRAVFAQRVPESVLALLV